MGIIQVDGFTFQEGSIPVQIQTVQTDNLVTDKASICNIDGGNVDAYKVDTEKLYIKGESFKSVINKEIDKYDKDRIFSDEVLGDLLKDLMEKKLEDEAKKFNATLLRAKKNHINTVVRNINKIRFDEGWTIIFWKSGDVTKVKCQDGESFDYEKGIAMAIIKHIYGDISYYNEIFKQTLEQGEKKVTKEGAIEIIPKTKPQVKMTADLFGLF